MPDLALTRARRRPRTADPTLAPRPSWRPRRGGASDDLVMTLVTQHADSVLRITRRLSLCDADAEDAYQRALEILIKNASRLDPVRAPAWLRTVARHEALAIRAQRSDGVGREDLDPDRHVHADLTSTEEQVDRGDRFARAAEALRDLKPDEARALWLKAEGYSYDEIATASSWSYTKVNRLLAEGRARFLSRYATIESGGACEEWGPVLSAIVDGEVEPETRRNAGVHLRSCLGCRATLRELRSSGPGLQSALPAVGLLAADDGGQRADPGPILRTLETLWSAVHERTAAAAINVQTAADAISAGKVAAVTASVAALAGGGVVVAEHEGAPSGHRPAVVKRAEPTAAREPESTTAAAAVATAPTPTTSTTASSSSGAGTAQEKPASKPKHRKPEFSPPAKSTASSGEFSAPQEFPAAAEPTTSSGSGDVEASSSSSTEPAAPKGSTGEFTP